MSFPTEKDLDRHFQTQLLMLREIFIKNRIKESDVLVSQSWLEIFCKVPGNKKQARNCLMLLMYSQLQDLEYLDKPFNDMKNQKCDLEQLLSNYDGKIDGLESSASTCSGASTYASGSEATGSENTETDVETNASYASGSEIQDNDDADLESNASTYGEASNGSVNGMADQQTKQHFLDEYKRIRELKKNTSSSKLAQHKIMTRETHRNISLALNQLKNWPNINWNVGFFGVCFQYFIFDNPELITFIKELDLKFKHRLEDIIKQECNIRQDSLRTLYEEHFRTMFNEQYVPVLQMERNKLALAQERERLQSYAESLKKREKLLCQHEQQYRQKIEAENNCIHDNSEQEEQQELLAKLTSQCPSGNRKIKKQQLEQQSKMSSSSTSTST